jgi:hypothetical protein
MLRIISRCIARSSGPTVAPSKRTTAVFSSDDQPSRAPEIALTSACRVTIQKPPSSKDDSSRVCGFQKIGALWRSAASSSSGMRSAIRSGSVKSKPGSTATGSIGGRTDPLVAGIGARRGGHADASVVEFMRPWRRSVDIDALLTRSKITSLSGRASCSCGRRSGRPG